nr:TetR family transcriptional regulator [Rhodococcus yunnanensis]
MSTQERKAEVLRVAAELFSEQGFAATGVREIAAAASVDPALVIRYFGSKESLFLKAMTLPPMVLETLSGDVDGLGERLVDLMVTYMRDEPGTRRRGVFAALIRASDRPRVKEYFRETLEELVVARLVPQLAGGDAQLRARLVAAQLNGLLTALFLIEDEVLLEAPTASIVAIYGRSMQSLIDG